MPTKILWDKLKKLYGNEPCTTILVCGNEMNNVFDTSIDDEGRSISSYSNDDEGTHLFMAQESEDKKNTSENDHAKHSY